MKRAFLSLYLLLTISILLLGFVLDKAWDRLHPPAIADRALGAVAMQLVTQLQASPNPQAILASMNNGDASVTYQWLSVDQLAGGHLKNQLQTETMVKVSSEQADTYYIASPNKQWILMINELREASSPLSYVLFICLFYIAIAAVVWFWVWPLTRDLVKLGNYVKSYKGDAQPQVIALAPSAIVYPVAQHINEMAARLSELIQSHQEMRSAVSHELRTPLARMKFALAMVDLDSANTMTQKAVAQTQDDIAAMENLINSLLAYAGFEVRSQQLTQTKGYIKGFLQDLIDQRSRLIGPHISIQLEGNTEEQEFICEWQLMAQVVDNLLSNAAKYAQSSISVRYRSSSTHYEIEVVDDGPGVPEQDERNIFQSFFRSAQPTQGSSGFGLGLAIVKRIMEWHGGQAAYRRSVIGGACFRLVWPRPFK